VSQSPISVRVFSAHFGPQLWAWVRGVGGHNEHVSCHRFGDGQCVSGLIAPRNNSGSSNRCRKSFRNCLPNFLMQKAMPEREFVDQEAVQSGEILRETSIHARLHGSFASCYADLALMGMQFSLMRQIASTDSKICSPSLAICRGVSRTYLSSP
jgi:hypothetical protein